ncbi:hypothetical protein CL654_00035 [bacterium]|nr:hypothetical protein [bacterium]|tara:strand:+ start:394 stop:981 length:588 start_codon:yes stop_codon:yes gene_type:complete
MEILNELFGEARVKTMRLFLSNPDIALPQKDVATKTKIPAIQVKKELNTLKKIGFLKQKSLAVNKKKVNAYQLNPDFPLLNGLKNILLTKKIFTKQTLARRFKDAGRVKLVITSGAFIHEDGSRVDLFVVGDGLRPSRIDSLVKNLEAELGRELKYAICDTGDFMYRLNAYDRFIRDILDYPHEVVLDKVGLDTV